MSEVTKAFKSLKKQLKDLKSEYMKAGKAAFGDESKTLFDAHPKMKEFQWKQYTPYFNDGEPCTFRACTYDPSVNGTEWWSENDEEVKMTKKEWEAARKDVQEFLSAFEDDVMEHLFGDHCKVTVTKKGAKVEEYSHD
jgi:hypothetical protein